MFARLKNWIADWTCWGMCEACGAIAVRPSRNVCDVCHLTVQEAIELAQKRVRLVDAAQEMADREILSAYVERQIPLHQKGLRLVEQNARRCDCDKAVPSRLCDCPWRAAPQTDRTIEAVREDLLQRSMLGIRKYGFTLCRNPIDLRGWLQHAYEECLDQANYLKRAIREIDERRAEEKALYDEVEEEQKGLH